MWGDMFYSATITRILPVTLVLGYFPCILCIAYMRCFTVYDRHSHHVNKLFSGTNKRNVMSMFVCKPLPVHSPSVHFVRILRLDGGFAFVRVQQLGDGQGRWGRHDAGRQNVVDGRLKQ